MDEKTGRRFRPRPAQDRTAESISIVSRAQDVRDQLAGHDGDLRTAGSEDRRSFYAETAGLRERLSVLEPTGFTAERSLIIVRVATAAAEAMIADRHVSQAVALLKSAEGHQRSVHHRIPEKSRGAVFRMRRVRAEAESELGRYAASGKLLRALAAEEEQRFGTADHHTEILLGWNFMGQGLFADAEKVYTALLSRGGGMAIDVSYHVRCRHSWVLSRLGRTQAAVCGYDAVIGGRTDDLGTTHPDTIDARYSQARAVLLGGDPARALGLLAQVLDVRTRLGQDGRMDSLETLKYRYVAEVLIDPRDDRVLDQACSEFAEIRARQARRLGQDHPMTRRTDQWQNWLFNVREANRFRDPVPAAPNV